MSRLRDRRWPTHKRKSNQSRRNRKRAARRAKGTSTR